MTLKSKIVLLPATVAFLVFAAMPARAFVGAKIVIDKSHDLVQRHYDAPEKNRTLPHTGDWNLPECEQAADYCEAIPWSFTPKRNGYTVTTVDVSWAGSSPKALTVRVYNDKDLDTTQNPPTPKVYATLGDLGPDSTRCQKLVHSDNCGEMSADLQDLQPGPYHIAMVCTATPKCTDSGMLVSVHIVYPPLFTLPPTTYPTYSPPPTSQPTPTDTATAAAGPTPDAPLTPGADGPLRANSGRTIPLAQQAAAPSNTMSRVANLTAMALLLLIVGGGGFIIVRRIRRDLHV